MAYKLLDMAQRRWRRLNAAHLLPLVLITLIADPQLLTISLASLIQRYVRRKPMAPCQTIY